MIEAAPISLPRPTAAPRLLLPVTRLVTALSMTIINGRLVAVPVSAR